MAKTVSSKNWLKRHHDDYYVKKARAEGYRSRAAYKLIEMDEKLDILKKGSLVVDLGAAPGGWSQVAAQKLKSAEGQGKVFALDILPMDPIDGVLFHQADFMSDEALKLLDAACEGKKPDIVLSDMAQNTVGHRKTDHLRTLVLVEYAVHFALENLAEGGTFVTKVFQGGADGDVLNLLKQNFSQIKHIKPKASRPESVELYLVALGRKKPY